MWAKVVTGLATLQDAIQTLSSAYIKHTNAVLGEHGAGLDVDMALTKLGENPLLGGLGGLQRAASPARSVADGSADKKERKKRQHDPNAPKRPLTAYFLFMQTARPIIASDLGEGVPKGAISTEGTNRWSNMNAEDKAVGLFVTLILITPNSARSYGQISTRRTSVSTTPRCIPTAPAT